MASLTPARTSWRYQSGTRSWECGDYVRGCLIPAGQLNHGLMVCPICGWRPAVVAPGVNELQSAQRLEADRLAEAHAAQARAQEARIAESIAAAARRRAESSSAPREVIIVWSNARDVSSVDYGLYQSGTVGRRLQEAAERLRAGRGATRIVVDDPYWDPDAQWPKPEPTPAPPEPVLTAKGRRLCLEDD